MIFLIRTQSTTRTLLECSESEWSEYFANNPQSYRKVSEDEAHDWVRSQKIHETGLWIDDDGEVRYAEPQS